MNCSRVISENIIERYLDGSLDEATRDAFEEHYFSCESCLAELRTIESVRPVIAQTAIPQAQTASRPARPAPWMWVALAASIALAFLLWPRHRPETKPAVAQAQAEPVQRAALQLSDIQPAPYEPTLYRDGAAQPGPALEQAMRLYQQRQWEAAAAALSALAKESKPLPMTLHFAGVSALLAGQTDAAISWFDQVITLGARSPFEEEARFYRAQALALANRKAEAQAELDHVIALHGDYDKLAKSLKGKI